MTRRLNRTVRLFAALAAVMQFTLPAIVSVADTFHVGDDFAVSQELVATAASTAVSTETAGAKVIDDASQRSAHPVDCQLCWYLIVNLAHAVASAPPPPARLVALVVEMPVQRGVVAERPSHHSRAPPTLLG